MLYRFFFFQAEDGIRDIGVTGVQTCALPIYGLHNAPAARHGAEPHRRATRDDDPRRHHGCIRQMECADRSEERRVGKERRYRGSADEWKEKRVGEHVTAQFYAITII